MTFLPADARVAGAFAAVFCAAWRSAWAFRAKSAARSASFCAAAVPWARAPAAMVTAAQATSPIRRVERGRLTESSAYP